jgi:hypothetical protein
MNVESEIENLKEEIKTLSKAVFVGNGTPSLIARCTKLETDLTNLKESVATIKGNSTWLIRLVVSQLVLAAFGYLPKLLALLSNAPH